MPSTPTRPLSDRTRAEMEAGRKQVFRHGHTQMIESLREAGLDTKEITDPTVLAFHMEMAKAVGAVPETKAMRHCASCGGEHKMGERCPKVQAYVDRTHHVV